MSVISLKYCGRKEAFVYICSLDVELLYLRSVITDNHHTIKTEINIYSFLFVKNIYQLKKTNDYVKTIFISYQSEWRFYICYIISSQNCIRYSDDESRYW